MPEFKTIDALKHFVGGRIAKAISEAATTLANEVITSSPVDTGRYRGNWFASINTKINDIRFNGIKAKPKTGVHFSIKFVTTEYNTYKLGDTMYLQNNLPYAERLANGWSKQRPSGWIEGIMDRFTSQLAKNIAGVS